MSRSLLAIGLQTAAAAVAFAAGADHPWRVAADWWLAWFSIANALSLAILAVAMRVEGQPLLDLVRFPRTVLLSALPTAVLALVVAGPIGFVPGVALSQVLWGDPQTGSTLLLGPLPAAAVLALLVVFPVGQAAAELPTYFGYGLPRLEQLLGSRRLALLAAAGLLAAQHVALPFIFDWRYLAWRGLMFLAFALWIGYVVQRRPATLPYFMVAQALIDASLPAALLEVSG